MCQGKQKKQLHKNTNIAEAIPETFYGLCSVEPAKTSRFLSYHCSLLAHDCLVGVLVDELVLPVSEHAAGELRRAVAPRHVRHAQAGPELGVVSRGVRQNTAPVVIVTTATGRAVTLSAEATRKLQEHRQRTIIKACLLTVSTLPISTGFSWKKQFLH